jgi:hypothetical protein
MPKCVVRLRDTLDIQHSVVVYAESLYEAAREELSLPRGGVSIYLAGARSDQFIVKLHPKHEGETGSVP